MASSAFVFAFFRWSSSFYLEPDFSFLWFIVVLIYFRFWYSFFSSFLSYYSSSSVPRHYWHWFVLVLIVFLFLLFEDGRFNCVCFLGIFLVSIKKVCLGVCYSPYRVLYLMFLVFHSNLPPSVILGNVIYKSYKRKRKVTDKINRSSCKNIIFN